jgi:hypothetical protein
MKSLALCGPARWLCHAVATRDDIGGRRFRSTRWARSRERIEKLGRFAQGDPFDEQPMPGLPFQTTLRLRSWDSRCPRGIGGWDCDEGSDPCHALGELPSGSPTSSDKADPYVPPSIAESPWTKFTNGE